MYNQTPDPSSNPNAEADAAREEARRKRSEAARKGWEKKTPEQRSEISQKGKRTMGPEGLSAASKKGKMTMGAARRSEAATMSNQTRKAMREAEKEANRRLGPRMAKVEKGVTFLSEQQQQEQQQTANLAGQRIATGSHSETQAILPPAAHRTTPFLNGYGDRTPWVSFSAVDHTLAALRSSTASETEPARGSAEATGQQHTPHWAGLRNGPQSGAPGPSTRR